VKALRGRLAQIEVDYDSGLIDGRRYQIASEKVLAEVATLEASQVRRAAGRAVAATLGAADPAAAFDASALGAQRAVIDFFCVVRLWPGTRGRKFTPDTVDIRPRSRRAS
jgi:site-specific DNA recombinase